MIEAEDGTTRIDLEIDEYVASLKARASFTDVCQACFGGGRIQEMDRYGHYTPYVTTCLCCGGSGRVSFQQEEQ